MNVVIMVTRYMPMIPLLLEELMASLPKARTAYGSDTSKLVKVDVTCRV